MSENLHRVTETLGRDIGAIIDATNNFGTGQLLNGSFETRILSSFERLPSPSPTLRETSLIDNRSQLRSRGMTLREIELKRLAPRYIYICIYLG